MIGRSSLLAFLLLFITSSLQAQSVRVGEDWVDVRDRYSNLEVKDFDYPGSDLDYTLSGVKFWKLPGHLSVSVDSNLKVTSTVWLLDLSTSIRKAKVNEIVKELTKKYGKPKRTRDEYEETWDWETDKLSMTLNHRYNSQHISFLESLPGATKTSESSGSSTPPPPPPPIRY